jgi:hypothetical protein
MKYKNEDQSAGWCGHKHRKKKKTKAKTASDMVQVTLRVPA